MRQITQTCASVALIDRDAKHPHVAKLAPQIHRELVAAIDSRSPRANFLFDEITQRFAKRRDRLTEIKG